MTRIERGSGLDTFSANVFAHLRAISLCLENQFRLPALVLIYNGIDFIGALARPAGKPVSDRSDFMAWADHHMKCTERLNVSPLELYAARCAVLHTYGSASVLSESGKARQILYAWGNASPERPNWVLERLKPQLPESKHGVVVHIESLAEAFREGVAVFAEYLENDTAMCELIETRARRMFADQSTFPGVG